jgi:hypothetical protein
VRWKQQQKQMKKLTITAITLLLTIISMAQQRVKGHVTEKNVASPVINATIRMPDGKILLSDNNGDFSLLPSKQGEITLEITAIGFLPLPDLSPHHRKTGR